MMHAGLVHYICALTVIKREKQVALSPYKHSLNTRASNAYMCGFMVSYVMLLSNTRKMDIQNEADEMVS